MSVLLVKLNSRNKGVNVKRMMYVTQWKNKPYKTQEVSIQELLTIAVLVHSIENSLVMNDDYDPVGHGDAGAFGLDEVFLVPY